MFARTASCGCLWPAPRCGSVLVPAPLTAGSRGPRRRNGHGRQDQDARVTDGMYGVWPLVRGGRATIRGWAPGSLAENSSIPKPKIRMGAKTPTMTSCDPRRNPSKPSHSPPLPPCRATGFPRGPSRPAPTFWCVFSRRGVFCLGLLTSNTTDGLGRPGQCPPQTEGVFATLQE